MASSRHLSPALTLDKTIAEFASKSLDMNDESFSVFCLVQDESEDDFHPVETSKRSGGKFFDLVTDPVMVIVTFPQHFLDSRDVCVKSGETCYIHFGHFGHFAVT